MEARSSIVGPAVDNPLNNSHPVQGINATSDGMSLCLTKLCGTLCCSNIIIMSIQVLCFKIIPKLDQINVIFNLIYILLNS